MKWPFKNMKPGDVIIIRDRPVGQGCAAAHNHARYHGKRVATRTITYPDGSQALEVTCLGAPRSLPLEWMLDGEPALKRGRRPTVHPFESLKVGETGVYKVPQYTPTQLEQMRGAIYHRAAQLGVTFASKTLTTREAVHGYPEGPKTIGLKVTRTK